MFKHSIISNLICKLILFWFGMYSIIFAISEIYDIQFNVDNIALYCYISIIFFVILFQSYKTALLSIPILVFSIVKIYRMYPNFISDVMIGFCITVNRFLDRINHLGYSTNFRYNIAILFPEFDFTKIEDYNTSLLIVIIIFLALIIVAFAYKKTKPTIVVYTIIVLMLPGIAFRFMPSIEVFKIVLSFIISLLSINVFYKFANLNTNTSGFKKSLFKTSFAGKYILIVFGVSYILNTALSYLPQKNESHIITLNQLTDKLDLLEQKINLFFSFDIGFSGGISKGKLGQGGFRYSNSPILDVYTDSNTTIYLRAWVGKNYFNNRWFTFGEEETEEYLEHFGKDFMPEQITLDFFKTLSDTNVIKNNVFITDTKINYVNANKSLVYIPTISDGTQNYFRNNYFENKGEGVINTTKDFNIQDGYNLKAVTVLYNDSFKLLADNAERLYKNFDGKNTTLENEYRNFVYSNYIYLPLDLFEPIRDLALEITKDYKSKYDKVLAIQNYLARNYTYNLNPPTNNEKDFVEYFLFESKQGYCTYYATSMVLMLRALGIPARYVEGYLVPNDENVSNITQYKRTVFDKNAHAWPEVYFDSIGWLPFEPTVTYTQNLMSQDNQTTNVNFSDYEQDTSTQSQMQQEIQEVETIEENEVEVETTEKSNNSIIKIFILFAVLSIIYILTAYKNAKHFDYKNKDNEQIINLIIELLGYLKINRSINEFPSEFAQKVDSRLITSISYSDILDITLKARFSKDSITLEETQKLIEYIQQLINILYSNKNKLMKFYLRFFLFIKNN